ncbi:hypothetical protein S101174_01603 [Levilactobacillus brevis]|nr:hypothetical protein S101174_01603 [Levilactobacillus brevis]
MKAIRGGLNGAIKIETLNPFVLRLNLWDFESGGSVQCLLKLTLYFMKGRHKAFIYLLTFPH